MIADPHRNISSMLYRCACRWLLLAAALLWAAAAPAAALTTVRVQLKWYHQFQFAGYYAAQAQNYYRDEGLAVELLEGGPDIAPERVVLERQAEFGIHESGTLLLRFLQGSPLVAVAVIFQHSPTVILSYASRHIQHPTDLIGRTVALPQGQGAAELLAILRREGITVNTSGDSPIVHFVANSGAVSDLAQSDVAAMSAYLSDVPRFRREASEPLTSMRPFDYGVDFYGDVLFTRADYAADQAETVRRFRRATLKGWAYAMDNPAEIVSLIEKLPSRRSQHPDRQGLLEEAQTTDELIQSKLIELGHQNPGRWENMAKTIADLGFVQSTRPLDTFIFAAEPPQQRPLLPLLLAGGSLALFGALLGGSALWLGMRYRQFKQHRADLGTQLAAQQRCEEALRTSEQRLFLILEHVDACVCMKDRNGRYLFANRAMRERFFAAGESEIVGRSDAELLDPDAAQLVRHNDLRVLESGEKLEFEEAIRTPASAKAVIFRSTRLPLYAADGKICGICAIASELRPSGREWRAPRSEPTEP